jgi:hypothetical protein
VKLLDVIRERQRERIVKEGKPLKASDFLTGEAVAKLGDEPVALVVALTVAEADEATEKALKHKRNVIASLGEKARDLIDEPSLFADSERVEQCFLALRDPAEPARRLFESSDQIRSLFTTEEIAVLCAVQVMAQMATSPIKTGTLADREAIATSIASASDSVDLDTFFARFPKTLLADVLIWACKSRAEMQLEIENLREQLGHAQAA